MKSIKKLSLCSVLTTLALIIFIVEAQIPLPIHIPGIKLGLANIITLFALLYLSPRDAFLILIARILLGSVFSGNPSVLLYSLSGGLLCLAVEVLCLKLLGKAFICEISVIGASVHNTVQILCSFFITKSTSVFLYLPPLLIAGMWAGATCGFCILLIDKKYGDKIFHNL